MHALGTGHVYAFLTALSWAAAVILFRRSGEHVSPIPLNYFKNVLALALLLLTFPLAGPGNIGHTGGTEIVLLLASGALGIGVADTLFFRSLNILGASRSAIVDCLYSPFVVLSSFALLGERLTARTAVGAGLVVAAVLVAGHGRWSRDTPRGPFVEGVLLGAVSMALMGVSIVAVKPILERQPVLWSTTVRMIGGLAALSILALPFARSRALIREAFRPQPVWRYSVPGSIAGTYIALLFWIAGFKHAPANIVSILNQTSTLFVVPLAAIFLHEPLTRRRVLAVLLGFTGSVLALS